MAKSFIGELLSQGPVTARSHVEQIRSSMWQERSSFDTTWRELGDWIRPRRIRFTATDRNRGDRRFQNIIDSTATFSARTLASGLHAGLTSPARPWFKLTTPDPKLADFKPVKTWLHQVTQRMSVVLTDSNVYNSLPIVYGDIGVFGTAAMAILEDGPDLFRSYTYPLGSYALGLNARNIVNSFARDYALSVRQVVESFAVVPGRREIDWDRVSRTVRNLWEKGQYESPVECSWVILPNDQADPERFEARYLPFLSVHYEKEESADGRFLRESGFRTFPILAPRWEVAGEDVYGIECPGMIALGDVRQLQSQQRTKGKAIHKMVDPPLVGHPELRAQKTSLLPGDITYIRDAQHGLKAIHEVGLNIDHLGRDLAQVQYRIQRAFYEDLFLMLAQSDQIREGAQPLTAREVQERHEEKLLALGPVLERTNDELLDPLIDRVYHMMEVAGFFAEDALPPPPELEGVKLKVEYISILAQAQKLVGVVGQDRMLQTILPLVEAFPEIRYKINAHKIVDNYAEMLGVDPSIIRTDEEANALQAAAAQEQAATATAERAALLGKAAQSAAAAPIGNNTALDRILTGGMGGGMAQ